MYVGGWFSRPELFASRDVCGWVVFLSKTLCLHGCMWVGGFSFQNSLPTYIHGGREFWKEKPPTHIHPWRQRVLGGKTTHPHTSVEAKSSGWKNHPPTYICGAYTHKFWKLFVLKTIVLFSKTNVFV